MPAPACTSRECPESCRALSFIGRTERARGRCDVGEDCLFKLTVYAPVVLDAGTCHRVDVDLEVQK